MAQKRKHYSKQFKIDTVKLITEQGYKVSEAARNLGFHHSSLRRWKDQLEKDSTHAFPGKGHMTPEKQELYRLRKEVKQLQMEREILKKQRPSLPKSRDKIRLHPAATGGLSRNRFVPGYGSWPEWVL
jgi:transposase